MTREKMIEKLSHIEGLKIGFTRRNFLGSNCEIFCIHPEVVYIDTPNESYEIPYEDVETVAFAYGNIGFFRYDYNDCIIKL